MSELFHHIDIPEGSVPLGLLDRRGKEITWSLHNIEHGAERKAALQHEMSCIALELWCRHRDGELEIVEV